LTLLLGKPINILLQSHERYLNQFLLNRTSALLKPKNFVKVNLAGHGMKVPTMATGKFE